MCYKAMTLTLTLTLTLWFFHFIHLGIVEHNLLARALTAPLQLVGSSLEFCIQRQNSSPDNTVLSGIIWLR